MDYCLKEGEKLQKQRIVGQTDKRKTEIRFFTKKNFELFQHNSRKLGTRK